ncbi:MAG: winged helix-turn-helix domain-containing protein [Candidatus Anammoxibacter sp.]
MTTKGNKNDMKVLKEFKEKYELTWPEVAEALGMSLPGVEHWHTNKRVPKPYKILIKIYVDNPQMFTRYRGIKV